MDRLFTSFATKIATAAGQPATFMMGPIYVCDPHLIVPTTTSNDTYADRLGHPLGIAGFARR